MVMHTKGLTIEGGRRQEAGGRRQEAGGRRHSWSNSLRILQIKKCPIVIANAALAKPLQELRNEATARYWDCFSSLREAAPTRRSANASLSTRRYANAMTAFGSFICWNTLIGFDPG
jgi:hypothetical protein